MQEKEGEILDVHDRLQDAENRVEAEVRTPSLQQKDVQKISMMSEGAFSRAHVARHVGSGG